MKELIILSLLISGLSLAIIYETNKSVESITKKLTAPHSRLETKN